MIHQTSRHCSLQQRDVSDYIFTTHVFSMGEMETDPDLLVYGPGYEDTVHVYEVCKNVNMPSHGQKNC